MKLKSEIWTDERGRRFVVMPEDEFARLSELVEDAGLSRILRRAKAADKGGAAVSLAEVKRQLGAPHRRQPGSKGSSRPRTRRAALR